MNLNPGLLAATSIIIRLMGEDSANRSTESIVTMSEILSAIIDAMTDEDDDCGCDPRTDCECTEKTQ